MLLRDSTVVNFIGGQLDQNRQVEITLNFILQTLENTTK